MPVLINDIDFEAFKEIDKAQLWRQVWKWYMDGEQWWIDRGTHEFELLEKVSATHSQIDPIEQQMSEFFDLSIQGHAKSEEITTKQIVERVFDCRNDLRLSKQINTLLDAKGFQMKKTNGVRKWFLFPREADTFVAEDVLSKYMEV